MASFLTMASASFIILLLSTPSASAQLSPTFYSTTCPSALPAVRTIVLRAIAQERRMGASLLRLFFHDCFVNGCDASLLLDDTSSFQGEKMADANRDSVRGFEVIDDIKSLLELVCPGVVSCADILAIAARDSVATLGGPSWPVALGRRDATTASLDKANRDIPDPNSSLTDLITKFADKGFSPQQMVALAGAHTIGQARCISFRDHIYNDTNIDSSFARTRKSSCPISSGLGDNNLAPLDLQTPTAFDNSYFRNLVKQMGLLHSDQELIDGGSTASLVHTYSSSPGKFASDFVAAIIKMGNISPLTGSQGQIRVNCRRINGD